MKRLLTETTNGFLRHVFHTSCPVSVYLLLLAVGTGCATESTGNSQRLQAVKDSGSQTTKSSPVNGGDTDVKTSAVWQQPPTGAAVAIIGKILAGGETPLISAVASGDAEATKSLLENGADVNAEGITGVTPLWTATATGHGHTEIVKLLVEKGADVNAKAVATGELPLIRASLLGHTEVVELLLAKGAEINAKDARGKTPLMAAAQYGRTEVVKLLLAKGAEISTRDARGEMPLAAAAISGRTEIVELLLEKGVDVNAKDAEGHTPLMLAVVMGRSGVVKLLLEKGADANAETNTGITPLWRAAMDGHTEIVKLLLEKGARVNKDDQTKRPGLYERLAAYPPAYTPRSKLGRLVSILVLPQPWQDRGIVYVQEEGVTVVRPDGGIYMAPKPVGGPWDPQLVSIRDQRIYYVMRGGLNISTPIAQIGNILDETELVKSLLRKDPAPEKDPDPDKVDGTTPLGIALRQGHTDVVELLRKAGARCEIVGNASEKPASSTSNYPNNTSGYRSGGYTTSGSIKDGSETPTGFGGRKY